MEVSGYEGIYRLVKQLCDLCDVLMVTSEVL